MLDAFSQLLSCNSGGGEGVIAKGAKLFAGDPPPTHTNSQTHSPLQ